MSALTHPNTVRVYDFGSTARGAAVPGDGAARGRARRPTGSTTRGALRAAEAIAGSAAGAALDRRGARTRASSTATSSPTTSSWPQRATASPAGGQGARLRHRQGGRAASTRSISSRRRTAPCSERRATCRPSRRRARRSTIRSDLYAVGIVLYELLVGLPPFVDKDAVVVMAKHIREAPPTAAARRAEAHVPRRACSVCSTRRSQGARRSASERRGVRPRARAAACATPSCSSARRARGRAAIATALRFPAGRCSPARRSCSRALSSTLHARSEPRAGKGRPAAAAAAARPADARCTGGEECEPPSRCSSPCTASRAGANVWSDGRFAGVTPLAARGARRAQRPRAAQPARAMRPSTRRSRAARRLARGHAHREPRRAVAPARRGGRSRPPR